MARHTSVMGIYPDRTTVSDAISVLHKTGYRAVDISVLSSDNQGSKDFAHAIRTKALEGAAVGAATGAVIGAASGAGAGAVTEVVTKGTVRVPAETILTFRLERPLRIVEAR